MVLDIKQLGKKKPDRYTGCHKGTGTDRGTHTDRPIKLRGKSRNER